MTHCDAARSARRDAHPLKALQTCVAVQRRRLDGSAAKLNGGAYNVFGISVSRWGGSRVTFFRSCWKSNTAWYTTYKVLTYVAPQHMI